MATRPRNIKVGVFLFVGVAALAAVVYMLGRKDSMFTRTVTLHAAFQNISGLVVGTPVRLGGMDVGTVEDIAFDTDLKVKEIHVVLNVDRKYLHRIRQDSVARLGSKGLLGDVIVNISVGSAESPPLAADGRIKTQETQGLTEMMQSMQDVIGHVKDISGSLGQILGDVLNEQTTKDIGQIVHSAASVMQEVEQGHGLVHRIIYDQRLANDAGGLVANARQIAGTADRVAGRVDRILASNDLPKAIANVQRAAGEVADVVANVRHGKGLAHTLIYEEDQSKVVENLTALSASLRTVADDLDRGRGTIGGLLKDPTLYSDLKIILGNVRRSRMLRALVRFSIAEDDREAPAPIAAPVQMKDKVKDK